MGGQVATVGRAEYQGEHQPRRHQHSAGGSTWQLMRKILTQENSYHILKHHTNATDLSEVEINTNYLKEMKYQYFPGSFVFVRTLTQFNIRALKD